MYASANGYIAIAKLFLEAGANKEVLCSNIPDSLSSSNRSHNPVPIKPVEVLLPWRSSHLLHPAAPLILASRKGHTAIVKLLLEAGANAYAEDRVSNRAKHTF